MRYKTIKKMLQGEGISKKDLSFIFNHMFGISDQVGPTTKKWKKIRKSIKKQQLYFPTLSFEDDYDFHADDFLN